MESDDNILDLLDFLKQNASSLLMLLIFFCRTSVLVRDRSRSDGEHYGEERIRPGLRQGLS